MAQKIYKMFQVKRFLEPWYQLSKDEQDELVAKVNQALEDVGGKRLVLCDALWSSDMLCFGVEEFPDIEAVQKHAQLLAELNWFRYTESEAVLGTEWQPS
jgi:hypothetical protein